MSLITKAQREYLTYWAPDPNNETNEYGEPVFLPPVEMKCRWDDKTKDIILSDNSVVRGNVELITEKKLEVNGIVLRSRLAAVTHTAFPRKNPGAWKILMVAETPDIRYRNRLYEAWA